jgi:hypothetical protein
MWRLIWMASLGLCLKINIAFLTRAAGLFWTPYVFVLARALLRRCAVAALSPGPSGSICSAQFWGQCRNSAIASNNDIA